MMDYEMVLCYFLRSPLLSSLCASSYMHFTSLDCRLSSTFAQRLPQRDQKRSQLTLPLQVSTRYPLVLIAMYSVLDLVGRYTPLISFVRLESRKGLVIAIVACFLFIPAFYFTAKYADEGWMIMLVSVLGLTNGHLTVCVMTAAPKGYKGPEQNALGNLLVLFLLGGIFAGVCLDWLWIIGNSSF